MELKVVYEIQIRRAAGGLFTGNRTVYSRTIVRKARFDFWGKAFQVMEGGRGMVFQGENAMLQNAAATGGLRGGNLQGALAKFRPQVLSQLINQRMAQLGGLAGMGQQAATTLGTGLGSAGAAGALARGGMWNALPNALMGGLGLYSGLGGTFGGLGGSASGGVAAGAMNPFMYAGRGGNLVGGRMDASGGW